MSAKENSHEGLDKFAEELASLVPRADGLDPRFAALLEKEAALTAELVTPPALGAGLPTPPALGAGLPTPPNVLPQGALGAGLLTPPNVLPQGDSAPNQLPICPYCGRGEVNDPAQLWSAAASAAGCGQDARAPGGRWAWPAAFSAMTTVAATLLVMLLIRHPTLPAAVAKTRPGKQDISGPATADKPLRSAKPRPWFPPDSAPFADHPALAQFERLRWYHQRPDDLDTADAEFLDQLLAPQAASEAPPASAAVAFDGGPKSPHSNRELLDQLLKEQRILQ